MLHREDTEDSDLDLLVDPMSETTLMDIAKIQVEITQLISVPVDVLTPNALPDRCQGQSFQAYGERLEYCPFEADFPATRTRRK